MRKLLLTTTLLLLSLQSIHAEPWHPRQATEEPLGFFAGFLSGYAAHELGHIITAEAMGFDAEFDGMTLVYPQAQMSDREHLQIASSGFQAQWLISEAALRYRHQRELTKFGNSYNAGLIVSHLAITAAYLTILMNHEDGDLQGASEATGLSNDKLAALVAIPALLDGWRLFDTDVPGWVPALSLGSKGLGLAVIWSY